MIIFVLLKVVVLNIVEFSFKTIMATSYELQRSLSQLLMLKIELNFNVEFVVIGPCSCTKIIKCPVLIPSGTVPSLQYLYVLRIPLCLVDAVYICKNSIK